MQHVWALVTFSCTWAESKANESMRNFCDAFVYVYLSLKICKPQVMDFLLWKPATRQDPRPLCRGGKGSSLAFRVHRDSDLDSARVFCGRTRNTINVSILVLVVELVEPDFRRGLAAFTCLLLGAFKVSWKMNRDRQIG